MLSINWQSEFKHLKELIFLGYEVTGYISPRHLSVFARLIFDFLTSGGGSPKLLNVLHQKIPQAMGLQETLPLHLLKMPGPSSFADLSWSFYQHVSFGFLFKYVLLGSIFAFLLIRFLRQRARVVGLINKIPGPPVHPWFPWLGHALLVLDLDRCQFEHGTYACMCKLRSSTWGRWIKRWYPFFPVIYQLIASANKIYKKEGICKMWMGMKPLILIYSPDDVEVIRFHLSHFLFRGILNCTILGYSQQQYADRKVSGVSFSSLMAGPRSGDQFPAEMAHSPQNSHASLSLSHPGGLSSNYQWAVKCTHHQVGKPIHGHWIWCRPRHHSLHAWHYLRDSNGRQVEFASQLKPWVRWITAQH